MELRFSLFPIGKVNTCSIFPWKSLKFEPINNSHLSMITTCYTLAFSYVHTGAFSFTSHWCCHPEKSWDPFSAGFCWGEWFDLSLHSLCRPQYLAPSPPCILNQGDLDKFACVCSSFYRFDDYLLFVMISMRWVTASQTSWINVTVHISSLKDHDGYRCLS